MKQILLTCAMLLAAVTAGLAANTQPQATTPASTVAEVSGQKITQDQLVTELLARYGDQVVASMIESAAIEQYAKDKGVKMSDDEITKQASEAQAQIELDGQTSGVSFPMWLVRQGLSLAAFREQVRLQALLEAMVKNDVKVSDDEVAKFYEDNKSQMTQPEAMLTAHIAVKTQDEADKLRLSILKNEISWDDAAKTRSIDPYGRDNAGLLGWVLRSDDPSRIAIFAIQKDEDISAPVQTQLGWSIFKRLKYRPAGVPPFEQMQDELKQGLLRNKVFTAMQAQRKLILSLANPQQLIKFSDVPPEPGPAPAPVK